MVRLHIPVGAACDRDIPFGLPDNHIRSIVADAGQEFSAGIGEPQVGT